MDPEKRTEATSVAESMGFYRFLLQSRRLLERNALSGMLCFFQ